MNTHYQSLIDQWFRIVWLRDGEIHHILRKHDRDYNNSEPLSIWKISISLFKCIRCQVYVDTYQYTALSILLNFVPVVLQNYFFWWLLFYDENDKTGQTHNFLFEQKRRLQARPRQKLNIHLFQKSITKRLVYRVIYLIDILTMVWVWTQCVVELSHFANGWGHEFLRAPVTGRYCD